MVVCQARNCVTSSSQGEPDSGLPRQFKTFRYNSRCNLNTRVNLIFDKERKREFQIKFIHIEKIAFGIDLKRQRTFLFEKLCFLLIIFTKLIVLIFIEFLNYFFIKLINLFLQIIGLLSFKYKFLVISARPRIQHNNKLRNLNYRIAAIFIEFSTRSRFRISYKCRRINFRGCQNN